MKRIIIAGIDSEVGKELTKILLKDDYHVIGLYSNANEQPNINNKNVELKSVDYENKEELINICNSIEGYLDGFVFLEIFFNMENLEKFDYELFEKSYRINVFAPNILVRELVKKMNYKSSIVIQSSVEAYRGSFGASAYASAQAAKVNLVNTFSNIYSEMYGVRINSIITGWIGGVMDTDDTFNKTKNIIPLKRLGMPEEIADDIYLMLTRHKYMTGTSLISDGGYLSVDAQSKTENLDSGNYYNKLLNTMKTTNENDCFWAVSRGVANEWNDDPFEREFMEETMNCIQRKVKTERIFIIKKNEENNLLSNKFIEKQINANSKYLKVFLIYEEELDSRVLNKIENGFLALNKEMIFMDLEDNVARGYLTLNSNRIEELSSIFDELKKQAQILK